LIVEAVVVFVGWVVVVENPSGAEVVVVDSVDGLVVSAVLSPKPNEEAVVLVCSDEGLSAPKLNDPPDDPPVVVVEAGAVVLSLSPKPKPVVELVDTGGLSVLSDPKLNDPPEEPVVVVDGAVVLGLSPKLKPVELAAGLSVVVAPLPNRVVVAESEVDDGCPKLNDPPDVVAVVDAGGTVVVFTPKSPKFRAVGVAFGAGSPDVGLSLAPPKLKLPPLVAPVVVLVVAAAGLLPKSNDDDPNDAVDDGAVVDVVSLTPPRGPKLNDPPLVVVEIGGALKENPLPAVEEGAVVDGADVVVVVGAPLPNKVSVADDDGPKPDDPKEKPVDVAGAGALVDDVVDAAEGCPKANPPLLLPPKVKVLSVGPPPKNDEVAGLVFFVLDSSRAELVRFADGAAKAPVSPIANPPNEEGAVDDVVDDGGAVPKEKLVPVVPLAPVGAPVVVEVVDVG